MDPISILVIAAFLVALVALVRLTRSTTEPGAPLFTGMLRVGDPNAWPRGVQETDVPRFRLPVAA